MLWEAKDSMTERGQHRVYSVSLFSDCLWLREKVVLAYTFSYHKKFPSFAAMLKFVFAE
jgi:hypothetical protein